MEVKNQLRKMTTGELAAYWNILQFQVRGGLQAPHKPIVKELLAERGVKTIDGKPLKKV